MNLKPVYIWKFRFEAVMGVGFFIGTICFLVPGFELHVYRVLVKWGNSGLESTTARSDFEAGL